MSFLSASSSLSNSFCCSAELLKAIVQTSPQSVASGGFFSKDLAPGFTGPDGWFRVQMGPGLGASRRTTDQRFLQRDFEHADSYYMLLCLCPIFVDKHHRKYEEFIRVFWIPWDQNIPWLIWEIPCTRIHGSSCAWLSSKSTSIKPLSRISFLTVLSHHNPSISCRKHTKISGLLVTKATRHNPSDPRFTPSFPARDLTLSWPQLPCQWHWVQSLWPKVSRT